MKQNKGITLIALVITIIVILILAGITIGGLTGENGVINKSIEAREDTERKDIIESAQMALIREEQLSNGPVSDETIKQILNQYFNNVPNNLSNTSAILTTKNGGYEVTLREILPQQ